MTLSGLLRVSLSVAGIVLVAVSLCQSWFDIPVANTPVLDFGEIAPQRVPCQPCFQALMALGLIGWLGSYLIRWRLSTVSTVIAAVMVYVVLTFPYFVMLQSPEISAEATWLQMQHDNLTWLGGDINADAGEGMAAWKSKVYWVDPPRQLTIAPLPTWSVWDVGLDKTGNLLVWLGYSNVYCQFVRDGWFCAMAGSLLLMTVTVLAPQDFRIRRAGYGVSCLCFLIVIGVPMALAGPFRAKAFLDRANVALAERRYADALEQLDGSGRLFPALREDSYFVAQKAVLESRLGLRTGYASLHRAKRHEAAGEYDQGFEYWKNLCDDADATLRREALRAMLRYAVQDYNCHRLHTSRRRLEFVLARQPANVKVIYYLQNLALRQKEPTYVYRMCDWMHAVTEHLNFGSTKILKSVSQQNAVLASAMDGQADETWNRIIRAKRP